MQIKRKTCKKGLLLCCLVLLALLPLTGRVYAKDTDAVVTEEGGAFELNQGDTVNLIVPGVINQSDMLYTMTRYTCSSSDPQIATVDAGGKVTALHMGSVQINVQVYGKPYDTVSAEESDGILNGYPDDWTTAYGEQWLFSADYQVTVLPDLSHVTVQEKSQTGYTTSSYQMPDYTFHLNSEEELSEDWNLIRLSCESSKSEIPVYASLQNNVLTLTPGNVGKTIVTVRINEKKLFRVKINTVWLHMNADSALLSPAQTRQLRIIGGKNMDIKWASTNPKVVSVSSTGKIRAKKSGNAVIKARINGELIGCAVSVVSAPRKSAINEGVRIAKTCTYSQPYRMQSQYYDCSSLVWKSYVKAGINFGNSTYAPVAASIGQWCDEKGKSVKGGLSQANINRMKIHAGDLMFETGADNGRYKGIYHVEMVAGYSCVGFDSSDRPILLIKWASKPDGYYGCGGQMLGRP